MKRQTGYCATLALMLALTGCGGGGSGGVSSTPAPTPTPSPTPAPTPTPTPPPSIDFDTAEYRRSNGVVFHKAITAYQQGASGTGVIVGVIDSGLSDPEGEFTGRISAASRGFGNNTTYADVTGHGTAVSGVISAARNERHAMGVAWGATIMALRTDDQSDCDDDGCTHPTADIAAAIDHAWQNGAKIINISLGGGSGSTAILQAVSRATSAGTMIVIAAGNNPDGGSPLVAPDGLAQSIADPNYGHGLVIIAPSVNEDDTVSSFSAGVRGFEAVSLAAMGNRVLTIDETGADFLYTGTSFAVPQIAGAAALLAQAFPNLTGKQIVDRLLATARDVGAPGADARYGVGVLDIAAAFAPQGSLSLPGSGTLVTPTPGTTLSTPMGDVTPTAISAVALDELQRAYRVDLTPRFFGHGPIRTLASALDTAQRHVATGTDALRLSLTIAPGKEHVSTSGPMSRDEDRPHLLSGTIRARLSTRSSVALGINSGLGALETVSDTGPAPSFLIAQSSFSGQRFEMRARSALALLHDLGHGLQLSGGFETGDMTAARRAGLPDPVLDRPAPYHAVSLSLGLRRRAFGLTGNLSLLDEPASALGARFAPAFGAQSAGSLFARIGTSLAPAHGLRLSASWQRGWTRAAAGGALRDGGSLTSQSWSADLAKRGLFTDGDLLGLRIAQPLRVIASAFPLVLPNEWNWESAVATHRVVPLDLVPRGRQRDYELSYGRGLGPGWLGANLYLREQSGNIAAIPADVGMALRWSMGF
jgi:hypothetical protein